MEENKKVFGKVRGIHSPEYSGESFFKTLSKGKQISMWNDWSILTYHILNRRDFFVTMDKRGFINNGKKEKFEEEFKEHGLRIMELNEEFIKELKVLVDAKK